MVKITQSQEIHGAKKYTESIFTAPRSTRNAFSRRQTSRTQIHGIEIHGAESVNQKVHSTA